MQRQKLGIIALIGLFASLLSVVQGASSVGAAALAPSHGIWISGPELNSLPTSGPAWDSLQKAASGPLGTPDISDNNSKHDTRTFAVALVAARTDDDSLRNKAAEGIDAALGTEDGGTMLGLGRNLVPYVVAADLINLANYDPELEARFRAWLDDVRFETLSSRTLVSTHEDRPNNWGTHAGASRIAADLYLGDEVDLAAAIQVFRGYLGDRDAYAEFKYGELSWQGDQARPVGINPAGATVQGHDVGGVVPDDQRRSGTFSWPPDCENYVREALQGVLVQAQMLSRQGYDSWSWSDQALARAADWFTDVAGCDFEGDDEWLTPLLNQAYGTDYDVSTPVRHGKHLGYTDWTHPAGSTGAQSGPVEDQASVEQPVEDQASVEQPVEDQASVEQPVEDQASVEQPVEDQASVEQPVEDQASVEQPVEDQASVEQPVEDQASVEQPVEDQASVEQPVEDQASEEQWIGVTGESVEDQASEEQPVEDQASVEQPVEDQASVEQPVEDQASEEQWIGVTGESVEDQASEEQWIGVTGESVEDQASEELSDDEQSSTEQPTIVTTPDDEETTAQTDEVSEPPTTKKPKKVFTRLRIRLGTFSIVILMSQNGELISWSLAPGRLHWT